MRSIRQTLTLDRPALYEIKVPGEFDGSWIDWDAKMTVTLERQGEGLPITALTGVVDQAALHRLLRRLYALGLPLISAICVACGSED